jgi:prepilin-type N-terminal cleavage/methylation domain-containing protein
MTTPTAAVHGTPGVLFALHVFEPPNGGNTQHGGSSSIRDDSLTAQSASQGARFDDQGRADAIGSSSRRPVVYPLHQREPRQPVVEARTMNRAGMTLVEVLVGLTVAGVALSMGFGALVVIRDNGERAVQASYAAIAESGARQIVLDWLTGVRLLPDGAAEFRGIDGEFDGWSDSEVVFLTTTVTPVHGRETAVRLFIDRDEHTPERGLVAEMRDWRRTRVRRLEIAAGARGLRARFLSGLPADDTWFPSWISTTVLPRGLELTLESAELDSLPDLLRWPIRVRIGAPR